MSTNYGKQGPFGKILKLINQCPICGHTYKSEPVRLFADKENSRFVHITCDSCKTNFMAMITVMGKGVSTVGMITDLSLADAKRLHGISPVTIDEAIEAHKMFRNPDLQKFLSVN